MFPDYLRVPGALHTFALSLLLGHGTGAAQTFFSERTATALDNLGASASLAFGDFNNDGWPDLFAASDIPAIGLSLQHNRGDGRFTRVSSRIRASIGRVGSIG